MTVEYILLLSMFALFIMTAMINGPSKAFSDAGPLLGARVERHLITGDGFTNKGLHIQWQNANK